MLIWFNVKNFLSFSEREDGGSEEFSMIAGKVRNKKAHVYDNDKIKLLKFAAIYGANAAGKSNLVKAMDFMKQVVLFGLPKGHTDKYCKIDEANKEKESYFELEIKLGEKYYAYGYEVILSQSKFVSEWLIELTSDNNEKVIFSRDIKNGTFEFGNELKDSTVMLTKLNMILLGDGHNHISNENSLFYVKTKKLQKTWKLSGNFQSVTTKTGKYLHQQDTKVCANDTKIYTKKFML